MIRPGFKFNVDVAKLKGIVTEATDEGLYAAGLRLEDAVRRGFGTGHGGTSSSAGGFPNTQTGQLRASVTTVKGRGITWVGTNVMYGRWLNWGASIRPRGKALGIPLTSAAKTLLRQSGGSVQAAIDMLKSRGKVFFKQSASGVLVILDYAAGSRRRAGTRSGDAWFLLTNKTIHLAPRPWGAIAVKTAATAMQTAFVGAFRRVMRQKGFA